MDASLFYYLTHLFTHMDHLGICNLRQFCQTFVSELITITDSPSFKPYQKGKVILFMDKNKAAYAIWLHKNN
jgi:hypothetical protein